MPLTLRPTGLSSAAYRDQLDYIVCADGKAIGRMYDDRRGREQRSPTAWSATSNPRSLTKQIQPADGRLTTGVPGSKAIALEAGVGSPLLPLPLPLDIVRLGLAPGQVSTENTQLGHPTQAELTPRNQGSRRPSQIQKKTNGVSRWGSCWMIPRPRVSALPSPRPSRIRSPLAPRLCAASTRRAWRVLRPACAPRVARTSMPRCEPWIADDRFQLGYEQGNLTVPCPGRGLGELAREICRRAALDVLQPPQPGPRERCRRTGPRRAARSFRSQCP
jgi:hypothetical protein